MTSPGFRGYACGHNTKVYLYAGESDNLLTVPRASQYYNYSTDHSGNNRLTWVSYNNEKGEPRYDRVDFFPPLSRLSWGYETRLANLQWAWMTMSSQVLTPAIKIQRLAANFDSIKHEDELRRYRAEYIPGILLELEPTMDREDMGALREKLLGDVCLHHAGCDSRPCPTNWACELHGLYPRMRMCHSHKEQLVERLKPVVSILGKNCASIIAEYQP
jgi:hypothetical protein